MSYYVHQQAPTDVLDNIRLSLQSFATTLSAYKVNLSDDQKRGSRTMAAGREGYARMISQIASNNVNSLPREHNPADLVGRLAYDAKLEESRQVLLTLMEMISETQLANSIDIMKLVDDYAGLLQISRNNNAALDLAMREVDDWNARFGSRPESDKPDSTAPTE